MLRQALVLALLAVWVSHGDPEPAPDAKPEPSPEPKPEAKPDPKAEPKAKARAGYGVPSYGALPLSPSYGAPALGYGASEPTYGAPEPSYGAPERSYGAPAPSYGAPAEQPHCYPKTHFKTTWQKMTQYKTRWATKQQLVHYTMYKYVTATNYWPTTLTEWKEVVKSLPYKLITATHVVYRTKVLLDKHPDYTNTEYVWHTQNYMDHHTVTKHITKYATKTNYYTDVVTEYVQKPEYYTETATVYETKYHTKKVKEPYYETIYRTVKKPQQVYETEYATKHQYHTVYATHTQPVYHTVTKCPSSSYGPPSYH